MYMLAGERSAGQNVTPRRRHAERGVGARGEMRRGGGVGRLALMCTLTSMKQKR